MSFEQFAAYGATIIVCRAGLWLWPRHAPKIRNFQLHHYMYGLVLMALYSFFPYPMLLLIGLGLFVDELPLFVIFKGWNWPEDHWKQYQSTASLGLVVLISVFGYLALRMWI